MTRATRADRLHARRGLAHTSIHCACVLLIVLPQVAGSVGPRTAAPTTPAARAPQSIVPDVPDLGDGRLVPVERDDRVERVVVGALRAEVTSSRVTFADDRFAFPIVGATRASAGWVFIAADGAVARAASFLGPLQPLGHAPRPPRNMTYGPLPASCGRAAIAAPTSGAGLWTTDGNAAIAPARGAPPGVVLSAAFADADHGMIAVDGGELFVTRDGATSFARVDLGEAAAASVRCVRGELHVMTSSGLKVFERDGRPTRAAPRAGDLDPGAGRRMTCTADRCAIDDRAGVAWHRSPGASNRRVLASPAGHPDPRDPSTAWPCTYQRAEAFAPRLEEGVAYVTDARGRRHYRRRGPEVALRVAVAGRLDVTQFELDWPGSRHAADPMIVRGEYSGFHMGRAIREGARTQVVWIPRAGRPAPGVNAWEAIDNVEDVLPLPDGTVAVLFRLHQQDEHSSARYQRLLVL